MGVFPSSIIGFTISTAKGSSLVISVIGYQEKQVVIGASNLIIELISLT
jgi:hypothetical protein